MDHIKNIKNWVEVTNGIYKYDISDYISYEIHILNWYNSTDILTAQASLYIVDAGLLFNRTRIELEQPVFECINQAINHIKENYI